MRSKARVSLDRPVEVALLPKEFRDEIRRKCRGCLREGWGLWTLCSDHRIRIRDKYPEEYQ